MRVLCLLLAISACSAPVPDPPAWQRHGIPEAGVAWSLPPGWTATSDELVHNMLAPEYAIDGTNCNVMMAAVPDVTGLSADERRQALASETRDIAARPRVVKLDEQWRPVDGRDAQVLLMDIDHVRPGGLAQARHLQVRVPLASQIFQLTCTSHRATFEGHRELFDALIASLQFR